MKMHTRQHLSATQAAGVCLFVWLVFGSAALRGQAGKNYENERQEE